MRKPYLIHHYLDGAAESHPGRDAVIAGDGAVSYGDLHERAGKVASFLAQLGVDRGDRVGIYMDKSVEAVVAIYGVLRAGAVYVPLDPGAPLARVGYMAADCGIHVLLTDRNKRPSWGKVISAGAPLEHVAVMDGEVDADLGGVRLHQSSEIENAGVDPPDPGTIQDDLAFILYTSGSTGDPKGVMLSHANCRGFVQWAVEEFSVTPEDRLSSHAPFHFDLSTFDLFGASASGASVVLVPSKLSVFPVEIVRFIKENLITVWYSVPSILSQIAEHGDLDEAGLPSLRTILFAGEVFPSRYLSRLMRLLPDVEFANLYGPTETNVCTWYRVPEPPGETAEQISIGRAIANVETYVVADDDTEAPAGVVGELFVRGSTVMKGYWGDPGLTAEKLGPSPLGRHLGDLAYRTGDLVEEMADGNYRFVGRRDNQIKSRGYRIELGDIENAVGQHPAVLECGVVAVPDEMISNRIECFVASNSDLEIEELTRFCGKRIPRYMIPERFTILDSLPKTSTGKIDRQALLERAGSDVSGGLAETSGEL